MKGRRQKDYRPAKRGGRRRRRRAPGHTNATDSTQPSAPFITSPLPVSSTSPLSVRDIYRFHSTHCGGATSIINKLICLSCSHLEMESGSLIISEEKVVLDWLADFIPGMKTWRPNWHSPLQSSVHHIIAYAETHLLAVSCVALRGKARYYFVGALKFINRYQMIIHLSRKQLTSGSSVSRPVHTAWYFHLPSITVGYRCRYHHLGMCDANSRFKSSFITRILCLLSLLGSSGSSAEMRYFFFRNGDHVCGSSAV